MSNVRDRLILADRTRYEANLLDILEETALEERHGTVDVRGDPGETTLMVGTAVSGKGLLDDALARLRPLLTGAAWKIVDQIIEHQLGHRPGDKHRTISAKTKSATNHSIANPLGEDLRETWNGVLDAYSSYHEVRHGLLHRRSQANAEGDIITTLGDGVTPTSMTSSEQLAMCRLACRLVDYLTLDLADYAHAADIGHQLSLLSRVQKRNWPERNRTTRTEYVDSIDRTSSTYKVHPDRILGRVMRTLPTTTCVDLVVEVDRARGAYLVGPLELAKDGEVVDPRIRPVWLDEEIRPEQRIPRGA